MSHRAIVSRRAALSWCAVSLATLMSSCAGLPSNDKVTQHSSGLDVKSVNTSPARAPGPLAGATPEAIIEGFVRAGVDSIENYAVARQYLSSSFAGRWNPMGTTRVYRNTVQPRSDDSGTAEGMYHVRFQQTATVNSQGITSTFPEAQTETQDLRWSWKITNGALAPARMVCGWTALSLSVCLAHAACISMIVRSVMLCLISAGSRIPDR